MSIKVTFEFEDAASAADFLLAGRAPNPLPVDTQVEAAPGVKTTRGRGRPAKGEDVTAAVASPVTGAPAATEATVAQPDPFAAAVAVPEPAYTKDDVAAAGRALGVATSQEHAVEVMKAATGIGSFPSLTPDLYGKAIKAFQAALAAYKPAAAPVVADPFGSATTSTEGAKAAAEDYPSEADLKKAALATQKRCGDNQITPVLIAHGGVTATVQGNMPSLKAVPIANRAKLIAALQALPTTR